MLGRLWRLPASKSLGSCAGVIFTAPEPNSGSAMSSSTIGISRSVSGSRTVLQMQLRRARVFRIDRDGGIAEHRLRARGRDHQACVGSVHRIDDVPEIALRLLVLHFEIARARSGSAGTS